MEVVDPSRNLRVARLTRGERTLHDFGSTETDYAAHGGRRHPRRELLSPRAVEIRI